MKGEEKIGKSTSKQHVQAARTPVPTRPFIGNRLHNFYPWAKQTGWIFDQERNVRRTIRH